MKHPLLFKLAVVMLFLITVSFMMYQSQLASLGNFRGHLQVVYSNQFSLIERRACDWDDENFDLQNTIEEEIRHAVSSNEIYSVSWSKDGHHGLRSFKPFTKSFSKFPWPVLASPDGMHTISYGLTDDRQILLIHTGKVPAGQRRQYQIAFVFHDIQKQRKHE